MAKKVDCKALAKQAKVLAKEIAQGEKRIEREVRRSQALLAKLGAIEKKQKDAGCV